MLVSVCLCVVCSCVIIEFAVLLLCIFEVVHCMVSGTCPLATGSDVLDLYNMNNGAMVEHFWVLALITIAFFFLAMGVFRLRSYQLSH